MMFSERSKTCREDTLHMRLKLTLKFFCFCEGLEGTLCTCSASHLKLFRALVAWYLKFLAWAHCYDVLGSFFIFLHFFNELLS
jgi:hypothetical protein